MLFICLLIYCSSSSIVACLSDKTNGYAIDSILLPNVYNEKDIEQVLKQLQCPFSPEEKYEVIKDWVTGDRLLDKGMFPVKLLQNITYDKPDPKIQHYMLYKTAKYILSTIYYLPQHIRINELEQLLHSNTDKKKPNIGTLAFSYYAPIIDSWLNLYKQMQWFTQNSHSQMFTSSAMFNILLRGALLRDLAKKHSIIYLDINLQSIQEILPKSNISMISTDFYFDEQAKILNSEPLLFKDYEGKININSLKEWYINNKPHFIIPIINKTGIIGLNPFIISIAKRYLLVSFSDKPAKVHHHTFHSFSDATCHDILHGYLPVYLKPEQSIPSYNRLTFYNTVLNIMPSLIEKYRQAHSIKDAHQIQYLLKHIYSLFLILHEIEPDNNAYEDYKNRKCISKAVYQLLAFKKLKKCDPNTFIPPKLLKSILFNTLDILFLFKKAYPQLSTLLTNNDLKIDNGTLVSIHQEGIPYENLKNVLNELTLCIADAWNNFVHEYNTRFDETIPFLVEELSVLQEKLQKK